MSTILVGSAEVTAANPTVTITSTVDVPAGSFLIAVVALRSGSGLGSEIISNSVGGSFDRFTAVLDQNCPTSTNGGVGLQKYTSTVDFPIGTVFTMATSGSATAAWMTIYAFTTGGSILGTGIGSGTSTGPNTTAAANTTSTNGLSIACSLKVTNATQTPQTGWTGVVNNGIASPATNVNVQTKAITATGSVTGTASAAASSQWAMLVVNVNIPNPVHNVTMTSAGTSTDTFSPKRYRGAALASAGSSSDTLAPFQTTPSPFYGPVLLGEGLFNLQIGPNGWKLDYKEKLEHGGVLQSVSVYIIGTGAYAGGTGGSLRCQVQTDSAGIPSGSLVSAGATATITTPFGTSAVYTFNFTTPPTVTKGQLLHFVFDNPDASPTVNFVSIDNIDVSGYNSLPQPTVLDADRFVNYFDTGAWIPGNPYYYPIFRTLYADGYKGGQSYYETGNTHYVGGSAKVHQRIIPSATVAVSALQVAVAKYTSTSADLVVKLIDVTGGNTVLATKSIPASAVHLGDNVQYGQRHVPWVFSSSITLTAGNTYAIELSSTEAVNPYMSNSVRWGGIPASFGANFDSWYRALDMLYEYSTDNGSTWLQDTGQSVMQAFFTVTGAVRNVTATSAGTSTDTMLTTRKRAAALTSAGAGTDAFTSARKRAGALTSNGVGTDSFTSARIRAGALTSNGAATDSFTPSRLRSRTLTSAGVGTDAFTSSRIRAAALSSAGAGTDAFGANRLRPATLSSAGVGTDSMSAHRYRGVTLASAGTSTDSFSPNRARARSWTSVGAGTDNLSAVRVRAAALTSAGTSTTGFQSARLRAAATLSAGTGGTSMAPTRVRAASWASTGTSTDTYSPGVRRSRTLTSNGTSTTVMLGAINSTVRQAFLVSNGTSTDTLAATRRRAAVLTSSGAGTDAMTTTRVRGRTFTSSGFGTDTFAQGVRRARTLTSAGTGADTFTSSRKRSASLTSTSTGTDAFSATRRCNRSLASAGHSTTVLNSSATRAAILHSAGVAADTFTESRVRAGSLADSGSSTTEFDTSVGRGATWTSAGHSVDTWHATKRTGSNPARPFDPYDVPWKRFDVSDIASAHFDQAGS